MQHTNQRVFKSKNSIITIPDQLLLDKANKHSEIYLYLVLKLTSINNKVNINTSTLLSKLQWKDNETLKKHLNNLKSKKYINFSFNSLPRNIPLEIELIRIKDTYTSITRDTVLNLLSLDNPPQKESLVRLYLYYIKKYNKSYGYAFPSYRLINQEIGIRFQNIKTINNYLASKGFLRVYVGDKMYLDSENNSIRERNKYIPLKF